MKSRTPAEMRSDAEEKKRLTNPGEGTSTVNRKGNPEVVIQQPSGRIEEAKDPVRLTIPDEAHGLRKSLSMTSIATKMRRNRERFKNNQCAGIILFLILGSLCNVLSYLASVWSAQLNAELIQSAVTNEHTLKFKLKKTMVDGPSKYLIGLLNFGGRLLSAVGTVMLVQVIAAYCKRRRYGILLKSAAGETDELVGDVHGGITDAAGECCLSCVQSLT